MSLPLIEEEIKRFLKSTEPEVLCVKGHWGVGKTYTWKKYLAEASLSNGIGLTNYSYVSLFGLNSLDDLKFSIFERTVNGSHVVSGPDAGTFQSLFSKGTDLSRRMRPLIDAGLALINRKGVGDVLFKTAFLAVQKQMICLDETLSGLEKA